MPDLTFDPPATPNNPHPFLQTIKLTENGKQIGQAAWACTSDPAEGVAQLVHLTVSPAHRRSAQGRRLMDAVTAQAQTYFTTQKSRLRRIWTTIDQKKQVIARAFLMKFTFHHVGTIKELFKDEDLLIYMRTFD